MPGLQPLTALSCPAQQPARGQQGASQAEFLWRRSGAEALMRKKCRKKEGMQRTLMQGSPLRNGPKCGRRHSARTARCQGLKAAAGRNHCKFNTLYCYFVVFFGLIAIVPPIGTRRASSIRTEDVSREMGLEAGTSCSNFQQSHSLFTGRASCCPAIEKTLYECTHSRHGAAGTRSDVQCL